MAVRRCYSVILIDIHSKSIRFVFSTFFSPSLPFVRVYISFYLPFSVFLCLFFSVFSSSSLGFISFFGYILTFCLFGFLIHNACEMTLLFVFIVRAARPGVHHQYTRPAGHPALVTHLARFYAPRLDRAMDPFENVLITSGATQGLFLFFQTFIDPGDEVIIMEPFYDSYPGQIEMAYGVPVSVPLRPPPLVHGVRRTSADWKLDFDELRRAFSPKTKALVLNTPHNPSGHVFTREELQKIADLVTEHDAVVLSDEVSWFAPFLFFLFFAYR